MTKNEFQYKIENGSDIVFTCLGRWFTISTWMDDGISIAEHGHKAEVFESAGEMMDNYTVNNVPLSELVADIVIIEYT